MIANDRVVRIGDLILHMKYHRWISVSRLRIRVLLCALPMVLVVPGVLLLSAPSAAQTPSAPINDNYLASLNLNSPGKPLNATDTLRDVENTSNATVQSDIFDPPSNGGGPEVTTCRGVSYGKTIWYDFYPQASGVMEIRTSGFDNVIALYPYNTKTLEPDLAQKTCVHQSSFPSETMVASVKKGVAYTVQIGGVNDAGGELQVLFDYLITPPHRLTASSTLTALGQSTGIKLLSLDVSTARAAKVTVDCGSHCRSESETGSVTEKFPRLRGVEMPTGSKLQIYVTSPHSIGAYIEYDIHAAGFTKLTRCLEPGSRKPRKRCS